MKTVASVLIASTMLAASTVSAFAAPALGLVGDKTLVLFDTDKPTVTKTMDVTGVTKLLGIDLRPGNKTIVGVTSDNVIVTIDPATGAAKELSKLKTPLDAGNAPVVVDFNPAADRLRLMSGTTNHRVNADTGDVTVDGKLAYEDKDMHKGEVPMIVAAAYSNSFGKPEKTAMYDVDAKIVALIRQTAPNDGTLAAIGKFGIAKPGANFAFDIGTTADGANSAFLVTGNMLYSVNLETGAATGKGTVEGVSGDIRDITILPAM